MKLKGILVVLILLGCTVGPIIAILAYEAYLTRDVTAEVIARAPERGNFRWTP
ncbi:MAG: hypothetical protein ACYS8K_04285 [Planctomycetota bacterium]|jgi:hypothetical protein